MDDRSKAWTNKDKKEQVVKREVVNNNFKPSPKPTHLNSFNRNDNQNSQETSSASVRIVKPTRSISGGDDPVRGRGSGITRGRGWKSVGRPSTNSEIQKRRSIVQTPDEQEYIVSQNFINKNMNNQQHATAVRMEEVERGISNMAVREIGTSGMGRGGGHSRQPSSVPPRLQGQEAQRQAGPKRYSSLRQRSLPETVGMGPPSAVPSQQQAPAAAAPAFAPHPHAPPPTIIHYTPHAGKFTSLYIVVIITCFIFQFQFPLGP